MSADRVSDVYYVNPDNQTAGKTRIEFLDTGPGISEVNKTELFESVIQFDANKLQSGGGSGLGLFISNAIMKRHLGRIGVMSGGVTVGSRDDEDGTLRLEASETSPSGCIFYIEVDGGCIADGSPSDANVEEDKTTMICSNNDNAHHHVCQGIMRDGPRLILKDDDVKDAECFFTKVLVVEDSKFNQKMMSKALDKYATRIVLADDGVQAVDAVRRCVENQEQPFDLIFMDSLMPNMNGIDATAIIIKELNYQNPVIAITGNMLPEDVKAFENAGVLTVLGKPLNLDTLHDVLKGMFL
jgi:CheY-like chemotaxis protein